MIGEFCKAPFCFMDLRGPRPLKACRLYGAKLVIAKIDRLSRDAHFLLGLEKAGGLISSPPTRKSPFMRYGPPRPSLRLIRLFAACHRDIPPADDILSGMDLFLSYRK